MEIAMHRSAVVAALALTLVFAAAAPALAGPPWISVEVLPYGTSFIVRTYHHGAPNPIELTGTAEGTVNGKRISLPLTFKLAGKEKNAFTVEPVWADSGVWVLNIATPPDEHGSVGATLLIDDKRAITVRFARQYNGATRPATSGEVATLLTWLDGNQSPKLRTPISAPMVIGIALPFVLLVLLGVVLLRVGRRAVASVRRRRASRLQEVRMS
jgi:hypothetical protein